VALVKLLLVLLAAVVVASFVLYKINPSDRSIVVKAYRVVGIHIHTPPARWAPDPSDRWETYLAPDVVCPGAWDQNAPAGVQRQALVCLIDYARSRRGLKSPKLNSQLNRAAELKAALVVRYSEFSHTPGHTPFSKVFHESGYGVHAAFASVGENLAYGQEEEGSPAATLDNWLNSPEHRQNLFTAKWRSQGISLTRLPSFLGHPSVQLWVSEFGVIG
jgi:hypothetical protein